MHRCIPDKSHKMIKNKGFGVRFLPLKSRFKCVRNVNLESLFTTSVPQVSLLNNSAISLTVVGVKLYFACELIEQYLVHCVQKM